MYADAVLAVVLKVGSCPRESMDSKGDTVLFILLKALLAVGNARKKESKFPDRLLRLMSEMFGPQNVNWSLEGDNKIEIHVDSGKAVLDPKSLSVESSDDGLQHLVSVAAKRFQNALTTS